MNTLKTLASVLILILAANGAAASDDRPAGIINVGMGDGSVRTVSTNVQSASGVNTVLIDGSVRTVSTNARPAGGGGDGGGGNIIVWDIVD